MYLNILKKDLKSKKTMNMILLVFIILATMFVSSSANNIISVTSALDNYFEMAGAPDFMFATMNKAGIADIDSVISTATAIEDVRNEKIIYVSSTELKWNREEIKFSAGTNVLQSDRDMALNYFLDDGSILKSVKQGDVYITGHSAQSAGINIGDKVTVTVNGISRELRYAGGIKDAVLGSNQMSLARYIINDDDFEAYYKQDYVVENYGGEFVYIESGDTDKLSEELKSLSDYTVIGLDRDFMKFTYIFDMIGTGLLLVISLILITIAFVVLRFTITFTIDEEYREIGVMKAIGISNVKIRGLYLVKYTALSVIGAVIGLILSFPFGEMLKNVWSKTIIISGRNVIIINILCAVFVVAVIMLFCYGCTGKVKRLSPIDAIRNGQTGERFRKKCLIGMSKSRLGAVPFMAVSDIVSSPKRYGIVTLTFVLCLSIMLMLSGTVSTLKSKSLITTFGLADCDVVLFGEQTLEFMADDGRQKADEYLADMEKTLSENGMPANCFSEFIFYLSVMHGENERKVNIYQGINTGMDKYSYLSGTAPQRNGEIAITQITANKLEASIGDNVTIRTMEGSKEYIITALYQTMYNQGEGVRLYTDENISYVYANGKSETQIKFTDNPGDDEIQRRIKKIAELYPDIDRIITCGEFVTENVGVAETLNTIKQMVTILSVILTALITVLMERSFIAKEQGEIALMKAVGMRNGKIYAYHTLRFLFVGIIAVIIGEALVLPLTHLCIDPIFKMMGMELAVGYVINPAEMYLLFPLVILLTTTVSAFLTSLYTRKIKSSDTANIE